MEFLNIELVTVTTSPHFVALKNRIILRRYFCWFRSNTRLHMSRRTVNTVIYWLCNDRIDRGITYSALLVKALTSSNCCRLHTLQGGRPASFRISSTSVQAHAFSFIQAVTMRFYM